MAWLFKSKSELPPVTHLQQKRSQQIESLKTFNHNVAELKRDEEYRVSFVVSGHTVALNITLPPKFPEDKPVVKVTPPLRHPWVNKNMLVTGCASLNNFVVNSQLGRVIRDIVTEFEKSPPVVFADSSNQQPGRMQPVPYPQGMQQFPYGQASTGASNVGMFPMPVGSLPINNDGVASMYNMPLANHNITQTNGNALNTHNYQIQNEFPELHNKSIEELNILMEDEEKLLNMVVCSEQMEKLTAERKKLNETCEEIASTNMSFQPTLESKKLELNEAYNQMKEARNSFEMKCLHQQSINAQYTPETILYNLKVSVADADTESEDLAQRFLDSNIEADDFLKSFMDSRIKVHLRRVKEEKLHHMITEHGGAAF